QPRVKALLSDEHFSVDGTLIEAWASMKSFKPLNRRDGTARRNYIIPCRCPGILTNAGYRAR
ncbi:hypothetical protein EV561_14031, partial [Rhizobium sp. BK376]